MVGKVDEIQVIDFEIPDHWERATFRQLLKDGSLELVQDGNHGGAYPKPDEFAAAGIPLITGADLNAGVIDLSGCKFLKPASAARLRIGFAKQGDVLLTHKGTMGKTAIVPTLPWPYIILNPQLTLYRVSRVGRLNGRFLKFFFDSKPFQAFLERISGISTISTLSLTVQKSLEIPLPPLAEQKAIAAVLGSLDDKIKLNRRMNATLEAMALALFQSWFVDFDPVRAKLDGRPQVGMDATTAALFPASFTHDSDLTYPTGWRRSPVTEDISLARGIEPGRDACNSNRIGKRFIRVGDVTGKRESDLYTNIETEVDVKMGEILVSFDGTPGAVSYVSEGVFSSGLRKLEGLKTKIHPCYLWCLAKSDEFQGTINEYAIGTTILHASAAIPHLRQVVSSPEVMKAFGSIGGPIWVQMLNLHAESRTLADLRDTLLPKLLSGQLRVEEIAT